jgi:uroporphyrinogen-III decarboxylase
MTDKQWQILLDVIDGKVFEPLPVGFIIDSPWLPGWAAGRSPARDQTRLRRVSILDYFTSDTKWFDTNLKAIKAFPEIIFLPGFWAEFGMCTEPSAFGTKCRWQENDLPFAERIIRDIKDIDLVEKPNPKTDGLLPFVISRLKNHQTKIEKAGHKIRFAVARGPLNIASFLMGTTEFLMAIYTDPDRIRRLLDTITDFLTDWLGYQKQTFPSIDGIFVLDDIVGFIGPNDFEQFALPYLKRIFSAFDVSVKFFHNDAKGLVCAPFLKQIGVNLFNFSHEHSIVEMKKLTGNTVTLLGNIPGRDVLASGSAKEVKPAVDSLLKSLDERSRVIISCGGGMPPDVSSENITAVLETVRQSR